MPRSRVLQKLFDEVGEVEYYRLKKERDREYAKNVFHSPEWIEEHKKKKRIQSKLYRSTIPAHKKELYVKNRKEILKKRKENYSPTAIERKKKRIKHWIQKKITFGNTTPNEYYDNVFLPTTHCNSCNKEFDLNNDKVKDKCLDHIHLDIDFQVRGVICNACNIYDNWRYRLTPKSIYNMYEEQHNLYLMEKKREFTIQNHLDLD